MEIRRYKNVVAVKMTPDEGSASVASHIVGFHTTQLEVAEVSEEAFSQMSAIDMSRSDIPTNLIESDSEAQEQIKGWNQEDDFQGRTGNISFGVRSVTINVTQVCNLKCTYCAAGGDGTYGDPVAKISVEKTLPQLKYFIDQLKDGQKFTISFVGGEPLLYPEGIKLIYDYVVGLQKNKNFIPVFSLITNATVITDTVRDLLATMKLHITVSLDGPATINDQARPTKAANGKSTDQTLNGIQQLNKIKSHLGSLGISAVISENNLDVVSCYQFFKTLNADWMEFNFNYLGQNQAINEQYIQHMSAVARLAYQENGEAGLRQIKQFDHYFKLLDDQQRVQNHCGAGKSYLMIDAKNQLYTCPWVVGEAAEIVGIGSQLNAASLEKYQKPLIELNNCQTCWAKYLCGGGCMYIHRAHTGDKHKKDNLFCYRTRSLISLSLVYYKMCRE